VVKGKVILTLALTEPDYDWQPDSVQTTAEKRNGDFILNGMELYTMDAGAASHVILVARTDSGIGLFIVDTASEGVSVKRIPGYLAGRCFEVKLDSVKVPWADLLGENGDAGDALAGAISQATPVLCGV